MKEHIASSVSALCRPPKSWSCRHKYDGAEPRFQGGIMRGKSSKLKAQYPNTPDTLIELRKAVARTYYREYAGEEFTFYFLGSEIGKCPYYLLSAAQMAAGKNDAGWLKE